MADSTRSSASPQRCSWHRVRMQLTSSCHQSSRDSTLVLPEGRGKRRHSRASPKSLGAFSGAGRTHRCCRNTPFHGQKSPAAAPPPSAASGESLPPEEPHAHTPSLAAWPPTTQKPFRVRPSLDPFQTIPVVFKYDGVVFSQTLKTCVV